MLTDYHVHLRSDETDASVEEHFTQANIERYRVAAEERGIAELGVSEHVYRFEQALEVWRHPFWLPYAHDDLDEYCSFVREQTDLRLGIEADFVPGAEDRMANLLEARDFDYVIGSVHFVREGAVDMDDYSVWDTGKGAEEIWRRYFQTIGEAARSGLFTYPILQAADILLYQADQVPVGEDQRQHLELSRTLAQRFNHRFGQTFVPPQPYILAEVAKIYDLQDPTAKMSKSSSSPQGIVDVLDEPDVIRRKIARAVTDPGSEVRADPEAKPGVTNLLRIYSALSGEPVATLEAKYAGAGYGAFKKDLAEVVVVAFAPIREQTQRILADEAGLDRVLARGAAQARQVAGQTMTAARDRIGLLKAQP